MKENKGGFIYNFQVRGRHAEIEEISYLFFANDILILCDASKENLKYMSWIVMLFATLSRLKINFEKSELISFGEVLNVEDLVGVLGCKVGALHTTYLGLPLGVPFKAKVWYMVKERFQKRLAL